MAIFCKICGGECEQKAVNGKVVYTCPYCGSENTPEPEKKPAPVVTKYTNATNATGALSGEQLYEKVIDSVVEIYVTSTDSSASASGFVVSETGFVVTNAHAVLDGNGQLYKKIFVKYKNKHYAALPLAIGQPHGKGDKQSVDLCLLYIGASTSCDVAEFGKMSEVKNGQKVYLIGNSLGEGTCITSGIISDKERAMKGLSYPYIMTDAAANPGNSGGPLFNEKGEIIGVLVAGINTAKGMNYAIPADIVEAFLAYAINNTRIKEMPIGKLKKYCNGAYPQTYALSAGVIFAGVHLIVDIIEYILDLIKKKS